MQSAGEESGGGGEADEGGMNLRYCTSPRGPSRGALHLFLSVPSWKDYHPVCNVSAT
jgi:hypothetical protein